MRHSLIALAILATTAQALAADLHYDGQAEIKQERLVRLYVRTRTCLGDAARAMLRHGVREAKVIEHFMVATCGDPLYAQLRRDGMPEEQARQTLVAMTKQALYVDVLRQPIPE